MGCQLMVLFYRLIAQYEDTSKRQKKELERLQRENDLLRNKRVTESSSSQEATQEVPPSFNAPVTTFEMTRNLSCKPLKYASSPTITTSKGRWSNTFKEDHVSSTGSENTQSGSSGCESEQSSSSCQTSIASPGDCESESSNSVSYIRDKSNSVLQNVTQSVDEKVDGSSDERVGKKLCLISMVLLIKRTSPNYRTGMNMCSQGMMGKYSDCQVIQSVVIVRP